MLGFARSVDHATHDGQLQLFHSGIAFPPRRHALMDIALDLLRQLLKKKVLVVRRSPGKP